ncbi:MAG: AMIN-like domain-containing (lipo)protein, partial [Actinomycetota bacterium]
MGTHPEGGYDRIALEFEGLPGYRIGYQSRIIYDGSGKTVDLDGSAFLQLVFHPAQAHDEAGDSTLESPPVDPVGVGYPALQAYVLNGDFEGYVSVALG